MPYDFNQVNAVDFNLANPSLSAIVDTATTLSNLALAEGLNHIWSMASPTGLLDVGSSPVNLVNYHSSGTAKTYSDISPPDGGEGTWTYALGSNATLYADISMSNAIAQWIAVLFRVNTYPTSTNLTIIRPGADNAGGMATFRYLYASDTFILSDSYYGNRTITGLQSTQGANWTIIWIKREGGKNYAHWANAAGSGSPASIGTGRFGMGTERLDLGSSIVPNPAFNVAYAEHHVGTLSAAYMNSQCLAAFGTEPF